MPTQETLDQVRRLAAAVDLKVRQHKAARAIAVREMMLDPKRLEFARWLISTGRITDYA